MRFLLAGVLGAVLFAVLPTASSAQGEPTRASQPGKAKSGEYRNVIRDALREFELGNWNEALALFERAHAIEPNARTLRGIGFCLFENRRYVDAVSHLEQALSDPRNPLTAAQHDSTQQLLERARTFVAHVVVDLSPSHAELSLDGAHVVLPASGELTIDPGEHELSATAPEFEPRSLRIQTKSGANGTFRLELRTIAQAPAEVVQTPAESRPSSAPEPPPSGLTPLRKGLMIGGFSFAGVSLISAAATGILALQRGDDLQKKCPDNACPVEEQSALDQAKTFALVSNIAFGAAAVGAALGLVGLLLPSRDKRTSATRMLRIAAGPGAAGLQLHGRF